MPRKSEAQQIAEKHQETMSTCPNFRIWVRRYRLKTDRIEKFEEAFNLVHKVEEPKKDESDDG